MTLSVERETRGVRWVLKMSDLSEGQGCPLSKEGQDLVFQCRVGSEETKMLNNLSDREFFVGVREAEKLEEDFPPYHVMGSNTRLF